MMQNFGDELGRECAEAMSVPRYVRIVNCGGVSKLSVEAWPHVSGNRLKIYRPFKFVMLFYPQITQMRYLRNLRKKHTFLLR